MTKFLKSNAFVIIIPIINFVLFFIAGFLLAYLPSTNGTVTTSGSGVYSLTGGMTSTKFVFRIGNAFGIWLIGLAVSLLTLLICLLINRTYKTNNN